MVINLDYAGFAIVGLFLAVSLQAFFDRADDEVDRIDSLGTSATK